MANRRKKGTGTIRKRSDGRYEGRVIVGYDDNGEAKVKTATSKTRREVVAKMDTIREENLIPLKGLKKDMPFGQWIDFWYRYYVKPTVRETTSGIVSRRSKNFLIPEGLISAHLLEITLVGSNITGSCSSRLRKRGRTLRPYPYTF